MDETTITCLRDYRPFEIPHNIKAILISEVDGQRSVAGENIKRMAKICENVNASSFCVTDDKEESEQLWEVRRAASPALYSFKSGKINEDVCVPRANLMQLLKGVEAIAKSKNITIACFGHAGDGNIHVNILFDPGISGERERADSAVEEIMKETIGVGGTLSGEHGIGNTKSKYLGMEIKPRELKLMKDIKALLDPKGILNPGKIF